MHWEDFQNPKPDGPWSLKAVQELLGHASMEPTLRYAHLTPHAKRDAVQLLDGPGLGAMWETKAGK